MAENTRREFQQPKGESNAEHLIRKHLSRRTFLKSGMYGMMSAMFLNDILSTGRAATTAMPTAKHCIILFMNGGPSQTDTFDPKPNHANGGPFKAIKTSAPDIMLGEHLPRLAEQAHHMTLLRSMETREGNHGRARYLMHTGYPPTNSVTHPTFPSILSSEVGDEDFDLPNAVAINSPAFDAAFLGAGNDPFYIPDPMAGVENLKYSGDMYPGRFRARMDLVSFLNDEFAKSTTNEALDREAIYDKADQLIHSPRTTAFKLDQEPMALRQAYGMNQFGQGCLMARRLIESGVTCVEVSLSGWDTHNDNFTSLENLLGMVDPAMSTLIADLDSRDLLHETLVIWLGEFGRTPKINNNEGRDHFPNGWTVAMAGGGLKGGRVIGATDESGEKIVDQPVKTTDYFYSLCRLFGVDPTKVNYSRIGRPISIVDGGADVPGLLASA
ncbi:MAG: DUF1501 domain-containing protein [Candidatus Poribacteria bacterium]|nr:DUF1501 domain-containing protein [Candidatus Poribacteria bacterium]